MPFKRRDISGQRFGRLLAIEVCAMERRPKATTCIWKCKCDCGKTIEIRIAQLTSGKTKSCGCYRRAVLAKGNRTHGMSNRPEYDIWNMMKQRCTNKKNKAYPNYGGRGIVVCERWQNSFVAFFEDMGPRPSREHTIDRINNNGNYELSNCRWATWTEQARNNRRNLMITHDGKTLCLVEWANILGFEYDLINDRLLHGWSFHDAITRPLRKHSRNKIREHQ